MSSDGLMGEFKIEYVTEVGPDRELEHFMVEVYDSRDAVARAAHEFNGIDEGPLEAVTQGNCGDVGNDLPRAIIRISRDRLTHSVVLHELVHATQHAYAWSGMLGAAEENPWGLANEDYAYMLQITYEQALAGIDWSLSANDPTIPTLELTA